MTARPSRGSCATPTFVSSFRTKADAQLFAARLRTDQAAGEWVSPDAGRVPLDQWADEWLAAYVVRFVDAGQGQVGAAGAHPPAFRRAAPQCRDALRRGAHAQRDRRRWPIAGDRREALRTMSAVMAAAVDARLIRDNPCRGVRAPRAASRHQPRFLTPGGLERLAAHVRPPYDLLVRFTAYTGLRWGEVAALCVADVDLLRGAVTVARSLERGGIVKDTKTHSRRIVHLEKALRGEVAAHIQSCGLGAADHVWTAAQGGPLSYTNFRRRVWRPAVITSGIDPSLRFHDLRHNTRVPRG